MDRAPHTHGRVIRHAWLYDLFGTKMSGGRDTLIDVASPAPGEVMLDVGCGTGTLALAVAARTDGIEISGIDASAEMIAMAQRKAVKADRDVEFRVGLIEEIPVADSSVDLVTSSLMLHHLPSDLKRKGLAEVRRVLKPDGRFVAMDFARESHSRLGHLLSVFGRGRGPAIADRLTGMITDAGFTHADVVPTRHANLVYIRAT